MSDAVAIELVKNAASILGTLVSLITAIGVVWSIAIQRSNAAKLAEQGTKIKEQGEKLEVVHLATNSLVDKRVGAAEDTGRIKERADQVAGIVAVPPAVLPAATDSATAAHLPVTIEVKKR